MKTSWILLVLLVFAVPTFAQSVPPATNKGVPINNVTSTPVLVQDDLKMGFRDYLLIQCTGANACYCCLGTNNNCGTTNGTLLGANGGSWTLTPEIRANGIVIPVPIADVSCITAVGASNVVTLDW
jgi:hypothetical protein